jgi:gliding motility-associated-like protein
MRVLSRLYISSIFIVLCLTTKAQLTSGSAECDTVTNYKISGIPDSIFIFTVENNNKFILAKSPNNGNATFVWGYYVPGTGYTDLPAVSGTSSKIDTITSNLGYRVKITEGVQVFTYRCWVFVQDFKVNITSSINDTISKNDIRCGFIKTLEADIEDEQFIYYHPDSLIPKPITYIHPYSIQWNSNQPEAAKPVPQHSLQAGVDEPYWKDTWYIISVISKDTKLERKDSAFYKSIEPHAFYGEGDVAAEYIFLNDSVYYPGRSQRYYDEIYGEKYYEGDTRSAPATYRFINGSENFSEYTWNFGDSTKISLNSENSDSILHTYQLPGTYTTYLIAKKNVDFLYDPCYDTFPKTGAPPMQITVDPAKSIDTTKIPNVFTPPNGTYKYWRFTEDVSIVDFEIFIFNRYGKKVYHFKGNIRDWEGWDGYNKETSKTVSTGVYYYIVKTIQPLPDFETKKPPEDLNLVKKGFIHVYNTE